MSGDAMSLERLRALADRVERAPYVARLGLRVERVDADRVLVRVPYKDENSNPGRALHGGVAASTIDVAGVLAAWTGLAADDLEAATLDLSVDYLAAAIGEEILAEAAVLRRGKELAYVDVDVRNAGGKAIAKGLVTHRALPRGTRPAAAARQRLTRVEPPAGDGDVPSLARAIVSDLAAAQPDRQVAIVIQDGMVASADSRLVRQVLENLIGNAWKFTAHSGEARIRFFRQKENGRFVYAVRDNGAGFDANSSQRLFQPFVRLHDKRLFQGSGIGLATARRIIERHGGRIWAESKTGQGATFFFTLVDASVG